MKKSIKWVLAASIICSISVFTACSNDDKQEEGNNTTTDVQIAEKIIGKWITVESSGNPVYTNQKSVITIEKVDTCLKMYTSVSSFTLSTGTSYMGQGQGQGIGQGQGYGYSQSAWQHRQESNAKIEDNKLVVTKELMQGMAQITRYSIVESNDNQIKLLVKTSMSRNGEEITGGMGGGMERTEVWAKVNVDYSQDILGLWEGHITSEQSKHDDGELHRWEYLADGTYKYYCLNEQHEWEEKESIFNDYFVDGYLLCTRWKNSEEEQENREWWEIESINADSMKWIATRMDFAALEARDFQLDNYTATFSMSRVKE